MEFFKTAAKAVAAGIVALVGILNTLFGFDIGVSEDMINSVLFALITILVYMVPNKPTETPTS